MIVNNVIIIHEHGHIICNQNATEYGNFLYTHGSAVFEQSPIVTGRKCGGITLKEGKYGDNISIVVWNITQMYMSNSHINNLTNKGNCNNR